MRWKRGCGCDGRWAMGGNAGFDVGCRRNSGLQWLQWEDSAFVAVRGAYPTICEAQVVGTYLLSLSHSPIC